MDVERPYCWTSFLFTLVRVKDANEPEVHLNIGHNQFMTDVSIWPPGSYLAWKPRTPLKGFWCSCSGNKFRSVYLVRVAQRLNRVIGERCTITVAQGMRTSKVSISERTLGRPGFFDREADRLYPGRYTVFPTNGLAQHSENIRQWRTSLDALNCLPSPEGFYREHLRPI